MRGIALFLAGILGVAGALIAATEYEVVQVSDSAMEPTYQKGTFVLLRRQACVSAYAADASLETEDVSMELNRGDVVLAENPIFQETGEGAWMLKRVVGLPGDWVSIVNGAVHVNGEEEKWHVIHQGDTKTYMEEQQVPSDTYFLLGDNLKKSTDSRDSAVGMVKRENIRGKVIELW